MTEMTGGCACGKVRFKASGAFFGVAVCHCTDCQKSSGGRPNYMALARKDGFEVTQGEAKVYTSAADTGAPISRMFCGDCGTPLWSAPDGVPFFPVKLGAFDDPSSFAPTLHLYTASAQPWHLMHEGVPQVPKMPGAPPPT